MATPLVDGDFFKVQFFYNLGTQYACNVVSFKVKNSLVFGITDQESLDYLGNNFAAAVLDAMSNDASYFGNKLSFYPPLAPVPITSFAGAGNGTIVSDVLSPQTCGLIKKQTALAGRRGRGRIYLPFPGESVNSPGGVPSAGYISAAETVRDLMITDLAVTGAGGTADLHAVLVDQSGPAPLAYEITSGIVRPKWATQRRRSLINRGDSLPF